MKVYYWRGGAGPRIQNWGDGLGPLILARLCGKFPVWAPPAEAEIVVVGSVLEHLPQDFPGVIAGVGKLFPKFRPRFPRAYILALRGRLSAEGLTKDCVLGDPGLLAPDLVPPADHQDIDVGIVPHWSDNDLAIKFGGTVIRSDWSPEHALSAISRSKRIVSSSLHGCIAAAAYGIPFRPELPASASLEGAGFKFRDFGSAIDMTVKFGRFQRAPAARVEETQHALREVFRALAVSPVQGK